MANFLNNLICALLTGYLKGEWILDTCDLAKNFQLPFKNLDQWEARKISAGIHWLCLGEIKNKKMGHANTNIDNTNIVTLGISK